MGYIAYVMSYENIYIYNIIVVPKNPKEHEFVG